MDNLIHNKWFKVSKFFLAGALVLVAIIALLASWYAGHAVTQINGDHPAIVPGDIIEVDSNDSWRIVNLVLGIIGLLSAIILLANRKPAVVVSAYIVAVTLLIVLLISASHGFSTTQWIYEKAPDA